MEKTRLEFIDRMKGIAILLVIIGHIIQFNNIDGGTNNKLFNIIYSFHMPLFFILSGYVASRGWDRIVNFSSFFKFCWKKMYTLVLPLFTWTLIVDKYFFAHNFDVISIYDLINVLVRPGLWFLKTLFEIQILFGIYCLISLNINRQKRVVINIFIVFLILTLLLLSYIFIDKSYFSTLLLYSLFFFIGSFISFYPIIEVFVKKKVAFAVSLILFLVLVGHWSINGNTLDDVLKVIISLLAFIVLLNFTNQVKWTSKIDSQIQLLGKESLAIYIMQFYLTSKITFLIFLTGNNLYFQFLIISAVAIPIAYTSIIIHRIFEKVNVLNFLFYGKKQ